jgi:hypothetical protein
MTPSLNRRDFLQATVATTALAWIPTEGKLVNNHWFDLREDPRISASSPLGRLGSAKTDRGVSHEVNRRIIDFAHDDQSSFIQEK